MHVDAQWQLLHGELVDFQQRSRGRFLGWPGVAPRLRRFVSEEQRTAERAELQRRPGRARDRRA